MKNLGVTLGYLDNIMICIDAAIKGSFTGLDVSVSVSVEEFVLKLNTIMLGLSQDTLNIDLNLYLEFITLYFEGEISQYQINALTRKVLTFYFVKILKSVRKVSQVLVPKWGPYLLNFSPFDSKSSLVDKKLDKVKILFKVLKRPYFLTAQ